MRPNSLINTLLGIVIMFWRYMKWLWRSWPILITCAILLIHYALVAFMDSKAETINSTMGLVSQIIGGLLVLYSIDSNLGIIRGNSLLNEVILYIKSFPLLRKSAVVNVTPTGGISLSGSAKVKLTKAPQTIQEEIQYLKDEIADIRYEVRETLADLKKTIDQNHKDIHERTATLSKSLNETKDKIARVSVGGVKIQFFGILLLIYGAICGYIS